MVFLIGKGKTGTKTGRRENRGQTGLTQFLGSKIK
jgi:hypothetical protein